MSSVTSPVDNPFLLLVVDEIDSDSSSIDEFQGEHG